MNGFGNISIKRERETWRKKQSRKSLVVTFVWYSRNFCLDEDWLIYDFSSIRLRNWEFHYRYLNEHVIKRDEIAQIDYFNIPHPVTSNAVNDGILANLEAYSRMNDSSRLPGRRKSSLFKWAFAWSPSHNSLQRKKFNSSLKRNHTIWRSVYLRQSFDRFIWANCTISSVWFLVKNVFTPPVFTDERVGLAFERYNRRSLQDTVDNEWKN